jgi:hypothetical protein
MMSWTAEGGLYQQEHHRRKEMAHFSDVSSNRLLIPKLFWTAMNLDSKSFIYYFDFPKLCASIIIREAIYFYNSFFY